MSGAAAGKLLPVSSPAPRLRERLADVAAGYVAVWATLPLLVYLQPSPHVGVQAVAWAVFALGWLVLVAYLAAWLRLLRVGALAWAWVAGTAGLLLPFGLSVPLAEKLFADPRVVFQFTSVGAVLAVGVGLFVGCVLGVMSGLHLSGLARRIDEARRRHLCPACGYDLRATADPDGPLLPRCPECGYVRIRPPATLRVGQTPVAATERPEVRG